MRDSKGRFVANRRRRRRHHAARRRHSARRNFYPLMANPRRRRGRRHHARRNPPVGMFGVTFPDLTTVGWTATGFLVPPFIEGFARRFLPAQLTANALGRYAVKIGSVILLSLGARQFVGREAGKNILLGGTVYVAANLANEFLIPQIAGTATAAGLGYYSPGRLAGQPLLGQANGRRLAPVQSVPERLRPATRF